MALLRHREQWEHLVEGSGPADVLPAPRPVRTSDPRPANVIRSLSPLASSVTTGTR